MSLPTPANDTRDTLSKVATVTFIFWIMKICATTVGETGGDLLSMTMNIGYAASSLILIGFFLVTLVLQMRSDRFHPFLYWAVILATSTAGTTISDYMDRTLGLGYATGAIILVSLLVGILLAWHVTMGSIKVDHIRKPQVELFYWGAILASNTLGTALGDYLADSSGLGYGLSNL
ncbi:MAG: putative membrane-anchored protein, partial [Hyphomonas sp.]